MKIKTWCHLQHQKETGEKIAALTAYDASFAYYLNEAGIDLILVGDSLGMVIQGESHTLNVNLEHIVYHTRCVAKQNQRALLVADMPFMTTATPDRALHNAEKLIKAGARMVKMEGGQNIAPIIQHLDNWGIAVCAHIGLNMQFLSASGDIRVQGRSQQDAQRIQQDAIDLQKAGAKLLILECVPSQLAKTISAEVAIPVIGIGAGRDCDGQILVTYDILGLTPHLSLRFTKNFLAESQGSIQKAICAYVSAVKAKTFPSQQHSF